MFGCDDGIALLVVDHPLNPSLDDCKVETDVLQSTKRRATVLRSLFRFFGAFRNAQSENPCYRT